MSDVMAQVVYDKQHGPVVRVVVDGLQVSVYLADETAVVTSDEGQYGLQVLGPWPKFRLGLEAMKRKNPQTG